MTKRKDVRKWKYELVHEKDLGEFKEIPGTNKAYKISKTGVVISRQWQNIPDGYWMVLKTKRADATKGFNRVSLIIDGSLKAKARHVSRLMLETWVGPPPTTSSVAAHKNGLSSDDRLENLMWAEPMDIKRAQICRGTWTHGDRVHTSNFNDKQIAAGRRIMLEYKVPANLVATMLGIPQPRVREWITTSWSPDKWKGLKNPLVSEDDDENIRSPTGDVGRD